MTVWLICSFPSCLPQILAFACTTRRVSKFPLVLQDIYKQSRLLVKWPSHLLAPGASASAVIGRSTRAPWLRTSSPACSCTQALLPRGSAAANSNCHIQYSGFGGGRLLVRDRAQHAPRAPNAGLGEWGAVAPFLWQPPRHDRLCIANYGP